MGKIVAEEHFERSEELTVLIESFKEFIVEVGPEEFVVWKEGGKYFLGERSGGFEGGEKSGEGVSDLQVISGVKKSQEEISTSAQSAIVSDSHKTNKSIKGSPKSLKLILELDDNLRKNYTNIFPLRENFNENPSSLPIAFISELNEHIKDSKSEYITPFKTHFSNEYKVINKTFPHIYVNHMMINYNINKENYCNNKLSNDGNNSNNNNDNKEQGNSSYLNLNQCIRLRTKYTTMSYYTPTKC